MSWVMAKDMAKRNEENLSFLSRKGLYDKLKDATYQSAKRVYKYKNATPEMLEAIRSHHIAENHKIRIKKIVLFGLIMISISVAVYAGVMFAF